MDFLTDLNLIASSKAGHFGREQCLSFGNRPAKLWSKRAFNHWNASQVQEGTSLREENIRIQEFFSLFAEACKLTASSCKITAIQYVPRNCNGEIFLKASMEMSQQP